MVKVTNALERLKKDGTKFPVLELSGGVELVLSQTTQRYYACVRRCTVPFTGTLDVAKMLVGEKLEGEVVKTLVPPYEVVNKTTGEINVFQHGYAYRPKDSQDLVGHSTILEIASL